VQVRWRDAIELALPLDVFPRAHQLAGLTAKNHPLGCLQLLLLNGGAKFLVEIHDATPKISLSDKVIICIVRL
jgi:hypothetical protein